MTPNLIREAIAAGESVRHREAGNSMLPLIKSKQWCMLHPISRPLAKGDIVYCRVKGRYYMHKVIATEKDRYLIGNNHGGVNGWTRDVIALVEPI